MLTGNVEEGQELTRNSGKVRSMQEMVKRIRNIQGMVRRISSLQEMVLGSGAYSE
jgi:hypothetical protein